MHSVIHGLIKESCENIHYSPCPKMLAQAAKRELKKNAIFSRKILMSLSSVYCFVYIKSNHFVHILPKSRSGLVLLSPYSYLLGIMGVLLLFC